jgi:hypothetical protein
LKTLKESPVDWIILAIPIFYYVAMGLLDKHVEQYLPIVWAISLLVTVHAFSSAKTVSREIAQEAIESARPKESKIYTPYGNRASVVPPVVSRKFYTIKLYGIAFAVSIIFLMASAILSLKAFESDVVTFKDSEYLTWWRRHVISYDIFRMQRYLSSLELPVPKAVPPFGVEGDFECGESNLSSPTFRQQITLGKKSVLDRFTVTSCYTTFAMGSSIFSIVNSNMPSIPWRYMMSDVYFPRYFAASFWGRRPDGAPLVFWHVRERLGKRFSDRLFAQALIEISYDSSPDGSATITNWNSYMTEKIRVADYEIDSGCTQWPIIEEILVADLLLDHDKLKNQDFPHYSNGCLEEWKK